MWEYNSIHFLIPNEMAQAVKFLVRFSPVTPTILTEFFLGSEVLMLVVMKSSMFWDITPCSPLTFNGLHGVIWQKIEFFCGFPHSAHANAGILSHLKLQYASFHIISNSWFTTVQSFNGIQPELLAVSLNEKINFHHHKQTKTNKLRGFCPQANYTDRETAACRRS
jgi:hypothetical protein